MFSVNIVNVCIVYSLACLGASAKALVLNWVYIIYLLLLRVSVFRIWIESEILAKIVEKSVDFKVLVVQAYFAYQNSFTAGYVDPLGA